jgi:hypothetical protein
MAFYGDALLGGHHAYLVALMAEYDGGTLIRILPATGNAAGRPARRAVAGARWFGAVAVGSRSFAEQPTREAFAAHVPSPPVTQLEAPAAARRCCVAQAAALVSAG